MAKTVFRVGALAAATLALLHPVPARPASHAEAQLGLIESFYQERLPFRAGSEARRFLFSFPGHSRGDEVELLRAKLYYRAGHWAESRLILISLLDRYPGGKATPDAEKLLGFAYVRGGLPREAQPYGAAMAAGTAPTGGLQALAAPPPGAVDPERAVAWSTGLPGSGFFLLGQAGKAYSGLSLNLFFGGATIAAAQQGLFGPALIFLLVEAALYGGGRDAVRQAAVAHNARLREKRWDAWLGERGEGDLLRIGLAVKFGAAK